MLVIGIAGGIACGKSSVAKEFQRLGAEILDADQAGHEVLKQTEVVKEILEQWGDSVVVDGKVDRKALPAPNSLAFGSSNEFALPQTSAEKRWPRFGRNC